MPNAVECVVTLSKLFRGGVQSDLDVLEVLKHIVPRYHPRWLQVSLNYCCVLGCVGARIPDDLEL